MGFAARWLVSIALLVLPIAITLGVLLGIDGHRKATHQPPLFPPDDGDDPIAKHGTTLLSKCDKIGGFGGKAFEPEDRFIYNPNTWGVKDGEPGNMCMRVLANGNKTYGSDYSVAPFAVTWNYQQRQGLPVHAYPNVEFRKEFPVELNKIKKFQLDFEWTYSVGNDNSTTFAPLNLGDDVNANVAVDVFVDSDKKNSPSRGGKPASYEVMIWLAALGPSTKPIGNERQPVETATINGTAFELYVGQNEIDTAHGDKQTVFTWLTQTPAEKFHGDVTELIEKVYKLDKGKIGFNVPAESEYATYMAIGTELYSSPNNVTFYVPSLSAQVE